MIQKPTSEEIEAAAFAHFEQDGVTEDVSTEEAILRAVPLARALIALAVQLPAGGKSAYTISACAIGIQIGIRIAAERVSAAGWGEGSGKVQ